MWTLTEYWLHRKVFHWQPDHVWGKRFHYISHGIHHDLPNDRYRLVLPLGLSMILSIVFGTLFYQCLGTALFYPFFGAYLVGYTAYDVIHYAVHHVKFKHPILKKLKRHHLLHHHDERYAARNFGVSSTLWDHVFGTY
jgi:sterol desaturase/sphingolipid hydroxylase (fatty acid hydroxylase superfamily)